MFSKTRVFCFLLAFLVVYVRVSHSLKNGDKGVCIVAKSVAERRRVTYLGIGYCKGTPRKWGCRVQKYRPVGRAYRSWRNSTVCCGGWKHDDEADICRPVCSTGCIRGECVAPSTCQCTPPLYLDPSRPNFCLEPVCQPCVNAICIRNDTCDCLANMRRYNDTHCAPCEENYSINADLTCSPICQTQCVNGNCTAPNECSCFPGYAPVDGHSCAPKCDECVNAKCVAPGQCSCLPGYSRVNNTYCEPICDACDDGTCVRPNQCVCREGYQLVEGGCEPICSHPCVNGDCSAPEECTCFEGYEKNGAYPGVCCRPECGEVCDVDGECSSVACVPQLIPILDELQW